MKKLLVLALAAVMALGASAVVGAEIADTSIPVKVAVDRYATIGILSQQKHLSMRFTEPGRDVPGDNDNKQEFTPISFMVRTNSPVTMTIEEDFVDGLLAAVGMSHLKNRIWPYTESDYIISPNIVLERIRPTENVDPKVLSGLSIEHGLEKAGEYEFKLHVESRWNIDQDWWKVEAIDEQEVGSVVITISAPVVE